jgi:hypothetical protein
MMVNNYSQVIDEYNVLRLRQLFSVEYSSVPILEEISILLLMECIGNPYIAPNIQSGGCQE